MARTKTRRNPLLNVAKEELVRMYERADRLNTLWSWYAQALDNGDSPDAERTVKGRDDGERYRYRVFDANACHGGILAVTFYYPGQHPSTTVHYFDTYYTESQRDFSPERLPHKIALDEMRVTVVAKQRKAWAS